ncbi:MAG: SDR family NAD(P)-dependent oxidoreductase [Deltaproteobacteria bacterium]|nr:SDR family NAD(P)-dependent oxidoreductase [Deltaproteobacteria bacterium]
MNKSNETAYSTEEIQNCISFLENLAKNSGQIVNLSEAQRIALMTAAGQLSRPDRRELKKRNKEKNRVQRQAIVQHERSVRAATGIRLARQASVFSAPMQIPAQISDGTAVLNPENNDLKSPRNCYICKAEFTKLHFFYDAMCPSCAEFNYQKRFQTASLHGQVALITGARVKIGYQATLMMLRAGARVIATTRFPVDAALRFAGEKDISEWGDRLHIYGLDLRHTPSVEIFSSYIEQKYDRLDILINNAAQTVRRPPGFYTHLMDNETRAIDALPENVRSLLGPYHLCINQLGSFSAPNIALEPALPVTWNGKAPGIGLRASAQLSQIPYAYDHSLNAESVFPKGELDADLQQVDLRETNSWRLRIGEIQTSEMLEIQLVNAVAPFVLCNRLVSMMRRDNTGKKHIVNVTAMEGKFFRFKTTGRHPHTNMAKAALNMLTHASAADLARDGIFMNAVDTGWVTDEDPAKLASLKQEVHDFQPPLDIVDGAARICDPFFHGILTNTHWCGKFLKDYQPIDW